MSALVDVVGERTDSVVRTEVWTALGSVIDPELDEAITDLGFVRSCEVRGGHAELRLRLPTAWCAPNFAYLMAADAYDAACGVAGVGSVDLQLEDHHDSAQINSGIAERSSFSSTYSAEADGDLDELRLTFQRKAHTACLDRVCRGLLARGWEVNSLHEATLSDLSEDEYTQLTRRRNDIGLSSSADDPILVDHSGQQISPDKVSIMLRFAKLTRVSIDGNAHFCRNLLRTRYPGSGEDQSPRRIEQLGTDKQSNDERIRQQST